jgi:citrate synthase
MAMFAQRIVGIMAHWREAMRMYFQFFAQKNADLARDEVRNVKLMRPTHVYTGETKPVEHITVPSKL